MARPSKLVWPLSLGGFATTVACLHVTTIGRVLLGSVCPIVRTSRTAFVCASDYDDRTQFHMFEQKNEHG